MSHNCNDSLSEISALFRQPLLLSDFEYYMFVDDRPSHPMVFVMVVFVGGCLQQLPFAAAVQESLNAHPLFRCQVRRVFPLSWAWKIQPESSEVLEWHSAEQPVQLNDPVRIRSIDLTRQCGVIVEVCHSVVSSRIVFYLHHACCDGIGGLQFISEVLARYGQKTAAAGEKRPDFETPHALSLLNREVFDTGKSATVRHQRSRGKIFGKIRRLLGRRPSVLLPLSHVSTEATDRSAEAARAIQSRVLPRSINSGLRAAALRNGVTVNDLCIREMLLQIHAWNLRSGKVRGNPWLRISVPVSMRTSEHQHLPACNMVSYAFVTRRDSECLDEQKLLESIHQQTEDVLFNRSGIVALRFLGLLRKIPGLMSLMLGLKSCFCTVVLANVGDVRKRFSGRFPLMDGRWKAGDVVVQHICGVAPVRPNTRAAVTIGEYAGDLSIHLRTDSTAIGPQDSERFLEEFSERLVKRAGSAVDSSPGSPQGSVYP